MGMGTDGVEVGIRRGVGPRSSEGPRSLIPVGDPRYRGSGTQSVGRRTTVWNREYGVGFGSCVGTGGWS